MADLRKNGQTSNIIRLKLVDATNGNGMTALTSASSGLVISTIADNEASATAYTAAGSTIETISTLGTFAAPTATKCRFKEVDATNHPGLYELQFADARFAVASAKYLVVTISGVTDLLQTDYIVEFDSPVDATKVGGTTQTGVDLASRLPANFVSSVVLAASTPTTSSIQGDSSTTPLIATNDYYNDSYMVFTSGVLAGISRRIADYVGATRTLTFYQVWPAAPSAGDTFIIIGGTK